MNCKEIIIFLVLSYQPKRTAYRFVGTAAFALSERISQAYIYQFAHKRKAERIPCRDRQTGKGYVPSVDKTDVGA